MYQNDKNETACKLRARGFSIYEISRKVGVAKSTVSLWVRNVILNKQAKFRIYGRIHNTATIEKRRQTRLSRENTRRNLILEKAKNKISKISRKELWLIGAMLYWAEGGKTQRSLVRFSNSDPEMIKLMMMFYRKICHVSENKFRMHIHIHPHLDYIKAEKYWSKITNLPLSQFFKTYRKRTKTGKHKSNKLPYGTADIYICDTQLFLNISGWVKGILENV